MEKVGKRGREGVGKCEGDVAGGDYGFKGTGVQRHF